MLKPHFSYSQTTLTPGVFIDFRPVFPSFPQLPEVFWPPSRAVAPPPKRPAMGCPRWGSLRTRRSCTNSSVAAKVSWGLHQGFVSWGDHEPRHHGEVLNQQTGTSRKMENLMRKSWDEAPKYNKMGTSPRFVGDLKILMKLFFVNSYMAILISKKRNSKLLGTWSTRMSWD